MAVNPGDKGITLVKAEGGFKECAYPHLAKSDGKCPYSETCGCKVRKAAGTDDADYEVMGEGGDGEEFEKTQARVRAAYEKVYGAGSYNKIGVSEGAKESKAKPTTTGFGSKKKLGPEAHERYTEAKKRLARHLGLPSEGWGLYGRTIMARFDEKHGKKGKGEEAAAAKSLIDPLDLVKGRAPNPFDLRKAPPLPSDKPAQAEERSPTGEGGAHPPGGGWQAIPHGHKGGYRRQQGTHYQYWYPGQEGGAAHVPKGHAGTAKVHESQEPELHSEELKDYNLAIVAGADEELSASDIARAKDVATKMKQGIEAAADVCKMSPPVCTGNLGIPRKNMPQILDKPLKRLLASDDERIDAMGRDKFLALPEKEQTKLKSEWEGDRKQARAAVDLGADANSDKSIFENFIDKLKTEGVKVTKEEVPVGMLKATQREIKAGKTYGMADAFLKGKYRPQDAEILISSDNHILDGHHRYAALITAAPDVKMKVTRVDMPMREFLARSFHEPGVFRADLQGNIIDPSTPIDLSGADVNKSLMEWAKNHPEQAREVIRKARARSLPRGTDPLDLVKAEPGEPASFRMGSVTIRNSEAAIATPEPSRPSLRSNVAPPVNLAAGERTIDYSRVGPEGRLIDPRSGLISKAAKGSSRGGKYLHRKMGANGKWQYEYAKEPAPEEHGFKEHTEEDLSKYPPGTMLVHPGGGKHDFIKIAKKREAAGFGGEWEILSPRDAPTRWRPQVDFEGAERQQAIDHTTSRGLIVQHGTKWAVHRHGYGEPKQG